MLDSIIPHNCTTATTNDKGSKIIAIRRCHRCFHVSCNRSSDSLSTTAADDLLPREPARVCSVNNNEPARAVRRCIFSQRFHGRPLYLPGRRSSGSDSNDLPRIVPRPTCPCAGVIYRRPCIRVSRFQREREHLVNYGVNDPCDLSDGLLPVLKDRNGNSTCDDTRAPWEGVYVGSSGACRASFCQIKLLTACPSVVNLIGLIFV